MISSLSSVSCSTTEIKKTDNTKDYDLLTGVNFGRFLFILSKYNKKHGNQHIFNH